MKILCSAMSGAGHAYPMLAVARALARRGHDVTFLSGWRHAPEAARAGCRHLQFPDVPGSERAELRPYDDAEVMARALAPIVEQMRLDVAVCDLVTIGPALASEMAGVPSATLSIHPLHLPSRDLPPFGFGGPPGRGIKRLRDAWMRAWNRRELARARAELNAARVRLGLPPKAAPGGALSDDLILVATLPSLEIERSDWPAHAHVIGPCLWEADGDPPALPDGDGPLVLLAPTTAHDHAALVRASLEAIERLGARAILTLGEWTQAPPALPRGVIVADFVPHDAVLPACDAVVCSGGHGIVARSLVHGVPLVVTPGHGDQRENGYRVERAGAGVRVMKPTASALAAALDRALRDAALRQGARRIRDEAAGLDGPTRAAELVEALGRNRGSPALEGLPSRRPGHIVTDE